jgi:type IV pilus assembly protein PilC
MSMLIKSGIAPAEGIDILLLDTSDKNGRIILESIRSILQSGEKFHIAIRISDVFPSYVVHMITIGEESGTLDNVLDALGDYYEREDNIRDSLQSAVSYPLVMIAMMFIVILILITRVLPIFSQVFAQLGTGMNAFSQTLLNLGTHLNEGSFVLILILGFLVLLFLFFTKTEHGHRVFLSFAGKFGPTRSLYEEMAAGRFASGMALTIASGMDTFQSLDLVKKLVENKTVADKIDVCKNLIMNGDGFPEALEKAGIFNQLYSRMVLVGFRSGSMDAVLKQIADHYDKETDRRIYSVISILEPTLVIILSLIVGMILLSVILPLMGIMSNIG